MLKKTKGKEKKKKKYVIIESIRKPRHFLEIIDNNKEDIL